MIAQQDLQSLVNASAQAGYNVNLNDLELLSWDAGMETHIPIALPKDFAAVYIFKWNDSYLKVGKVNSKSNARYQSQHYNPDSSNSNLSKSLLNEPEFEVLLRGSLPGNWLKENTVRFNVLIPSSLGKNFVHFAEAFFILKCSPRFENTRA